ncbi:hypothetical protein EW145_g4932 [Phellinidium pouzarii]|uniref:Endoplasmic reticulum-based factor for assembly of V-ATPase n=1 Tax=Phellinidium pouzarii TaxID=167371 RepID=A0A4S4L1T7_9AGAM|nr:hypothetical protein EW145_g4932 [Phellinidium pouzarii]
MSDAISTVGTDTTVSLEPHLVEALKPLLCILPPELHAALTTEIDRPEIHYLLLVKLSRWARTDSGKDSLESSNIDSGTYHMVSLLAGTRTAPSSKLPPYTPPESPEMKNRREWNDRKALTAVFNGLLTVGCAGVAAWWAADNLGWRSEWKAILALMVGGVVGISETILFIIWQSRASKEANGHRRKAVASCKKSDGDGRLTSAPPEASIPVIDREKDVGAQPRRRIARKLEG